MSFKNILTRPILKKITWIYTGLILLLVTLPINGEDQFLGKLNDNYVLTIRYDYLSHALLFVPWVLAMGYGWELLSKTWPRLGLLFFFSLLFAVFCEYIQLLLPYRTFNINDLAANSLSIVLGFLILILSKRLIKEEYANG